jgi:hypothetical protein
MQSVPAAHRIDGLHRSYGPAVAPPALPPPPPLPPLLPAVPPELPAPPEAPAPPEPPAPLPPPEEHVGPVEVTVHILEPQSCAAPGPWCVHCPPPSTVGKQICIFLLSKEQRSLLSVVSGLQMPPRPSGSTQLATVCVLPPLVYDPVMHIWAVEHALISLRSSNTPSELQICTVFRSEQPCSDSLQVVFEAPHDKMSGVNVNKTACTVA